MGELFVTVEGTKKKGVDNADAPHQSPERRSPRAGAFTSWGEVVPAHCVGKKVAGSFRLNFKKKPRRWPRLREE